MRGSSHHPHVDTGVESARALPNPDHVIQTSGGSCNQQQILSGGVCPELNTTKAKRKEQSPLGLPSHT